MRSARGATWRRGAATIPWSSSTATPIPQDQELVALVASALAFGNVKALRAKIEDALGRIGPGVARAADDPAALRARLRGWKHRVYRDEDLAGLLVGARRVQRAAGSLGAALARELERTGDPARRAVGLDGSDPARGRASIERRSGAAARTSCADPAKGSAVKRLMLLLRWMARPADGVDLGLWATIPPALLLVPVDTHIHKLGAQPGSDAPQRRLVEDGGGDHRRAASLRPCRSRRNTTSRSATWGCSSAAPRAAIPPAARVRREGRLPALGGRLKTFTLAIPSCRDARRPGTRRHQPQEFAGRHGGTAAA